MLNQIFTIVTRLECTEELMSYIKAYITEYNQVYREMWHIMVSSDYGICYPKASTFVTEMCQTYDMLKRTINSIRFDIKGRIQSLKALKQTELNQLRVKILQKEKNIQKLIERINQRKPLAEKNQLTEQQLEMYRR